MIPSSPRTTEARRPLLAALIPAAGVVAVPGIVIPAIIWARVAYHFRHPDASPDSYLTISRAISDPVIGDPFAVWIGLAAVLLWLTYGWMLRMFRALHPVRPAPAGWRDPAARLVLWASWVAMTGSCLGMLALSRFGLDGDEVEQARHMAGSYLFFISQATALFLVALYHHLIAAARRAAPEPFFFADRWRIAGGYLITVAAILYGVLFAVKSWDLGAATPWVIAVYVELETILICGFLIYLLFYCVDVFVWSRGPRAAGLTARWGRAGAGRAAPRRRRG